jgi:hypothetical protein
MGLLVVAHATLGVCLNPSGTSPDGVAEILVPLIAGLLFSQPILFALWAALGPQRFYHRFLWAFLLCSLVSFVVDLGNLRHARGDLGSVMVLYAAIFIVGTTFLLVFRRLSRWCVKRRHAIDVSSGYHAGQFGIKHLLILVTITALACGLLKTLQMVNPNLGLGPSLIEFVGCLLMVAVLFVPVAMIPWYTLAYRGRPIVLSLVMVVSLVVCDVVACGVAMTVMPINTGDIPEFVGTLLLMQLGTGLSTIGSTLVIRWCGFRMIREGSKGAGVLD